MRRTLQDYLHGSGTLERVKTAEDFAALCRAAAEDSAGRLRWRLNRRLGLPPWAGTPGRDEYLYALANLQADRDERMAAMCPSCAQAAEGARCLCCGAPLPTVNPAFDETRYEELKHEGSAI